ncbi:hypothetical protein ASPZODRAFT_155448 [Penicilliopsis zonata CBS 506.65]|uniref:Tat pathway signal sequence n=1 Tax=Penicilliopsis zonata CBS 506.65 TaxID=1073090 RepID=A0A1L9S508_9EURO|nr:hypothetical protein ASPZODRAFT_155448 [Penicilliopsis zonata CBS 506.65]OJJ42237.1 hypothetical protein ASPZODRAFT_155448 [Penicilliopsis zonata CBS 506.65]
MTELPRLVNKTIPIPEYPDEYIVELDVFHQLHCLNLVRLKAWTAENPEYGDNGVNPHLQKMDHIDHCIDTMRQSLMCSADISPIVWNWDPASQSAKGRASTLHTCRDFEAIRQWAIEHHTDAFNTSVHTHDPLED